MRLRAGCDYYLNRIAQEDPVVVKHKNTGQHGVVTRATPSGNHIPAQAFVVYGDDESGYEEAWVPSRELERA